MAKPDRTLAARKVLAAARGARLCYGEPVQVDGRTVIPVARVRAGGVFAKVGGRGGVKSEPVGFIEVAAEGTRFERIEQPRVGAKALATGGAAIAGLVATAAIKRPRRALPRPPRRRLLPR
jgi:hypothetical protein